jgi:ferredoxin
MTVVREFLGHTRMARKPIVSVAHWFTAMGFLMLFATLVNAFFQLLWADFRLPIVGHFAPFEWLIELFAVTGLIGIMRAHPHPPEGTTPAQRRASVVGAARFFGSTWWQAYYVEFTIFVVMICILSLRTLEAALISRIEPDTNDHAALPAHRVGAPICGGLSEQWLRESIYIVAAIKILTSFAWMITISLTPTMGVAWHRFLAFVNIFFKRHADGRTSLGAVQPMMVAGKPFDMEAMEDLDEDTTLGVGKAEDFTWKGLLDFTTCTECGRCQSQCPAWNTDKPLSPKLLVMTLRDHAHAKAPWLMATEEKRKDLPAHTLKLADAPLVGSPGHTTWLTR